MYDSGPGFAAAPNLFCTTEYKIFDAIKNTDTTFKDDANGLV